MIDSIAQSPAPVKRREAFVDFYTALQAVAEGRRITRMEWQDSNVYGFLKDKETIRIMTFNEATDSYEEHTWLLSYSDLFAEDWVILD